MLRFESGSKPTNTILFGQALPIFRDNRMVILVRVQQGKGRAGERAGGSYIKYKHAQCAVAKPRYCNSTFVINVLA